MGNLNQAIKNIEDNFQFFIQYYPFRKTNGWKLSIQGKTKTDVKFLLTKLFDYLMKEKISFKFATNRLLKHKKAGEQKNKVLTIYCPLNTEILDLAKEMGKRIKSYKGFTGVKAPTSYAYYKYGIYYRNDRDEKGRYIPAN